MDPELLYRGMAASLLDSSDNSEDKELEAMELPPLAETSSWTSRPKMPYKRFYDDGAFFWKDTAPLEPEPFTCTSRVHCRGAPAVAKCYSCVKFDPHGRGWLCKKCLEHRHPWYRAPHKIVSIHHEESVEREFDAQVHRADMHRLKRRVAQLTRRVGHLKNSVEAQNMDPKADDVLKATARKLMSVEQRMTFLRDDVNARGLAALEPIAIGTASSLASSSSLSSLSMSQVSSTGLSRTSTPLAQGSVSQEEASFSESLKSDKHKEDLYCRLCVDTERQGGVDTQPAARDEWPRADKSILSSDVSEASGDKKHLPGPQSADPDSDFKYACEKAGEESSMEESNAKINGVVRIQSMLRRWKARRHAQELVFKRFERIFDDQYGEWFYFDNVTGESVWKRPYCLDDNTVTSMTVGELDDEIEEH